MRTNRWAMTGAVLLVSLLVVPLVLLLSPGLVSSASTFTVDSTAGTVDANLGDGIAADASGNTTLWVAIMEANALAGADTIILPAGRHLHPDHRRRH